MLKNNNQPVINHMAKTNLKSNFRRSITMTVAVLLSSFLLFCVFTVGLTYLKMNKLQNIRLNGADFDAILYGVTEEQKTILENDENVKRVFTVGLTYLKMNKLQNIRLNGADFDAILYGVTEEQKTILENDENVKQFGILTVAGAVKETEADKTPGVGLVYADEILWEDMMAPTRTFLQGKYPTAENEIMVTEEALKKCGFENKKTGDDMMAPTRTFLQGKYPTAENEIMVTEEALKKCGFENKKTGDEITFIYEIKEKRQEKTFRISGIWDGFGSIDNFFVSKAFCDQEGIEELYHSRCNISFEKRWMSEDEQQSFIDKMKLKKSQRLFYVYEFGNAAEIFCGIAGIWQCHGDFLWNCRDCSSYLSERLSADL